MKKIALMSAAAAVLSIAAASASAAPVLGGVQIVCLNGKYQPGTIATDAVETEMLYIKKAWTPGCSNNVSLSAAEVSGWVVIAAASSKGKYYMGGNTEGLAPACVKDVAGNSKCSEATIALVNPIEPAATHADNTKTLVGTGFASGITTEPFSPCAWVPAGETKAGCQ